MSLELVKDFVKVNRLIAVDNATTIIENDIIVPDSKPDFGEMLLSDGEIQGEKAEVYSDRVVISGSIIYKILYISDDGRGKIKSITAPSGFSVTIAAAGAKAHSKCDVKCSLDHIEYSVINSRKLNVRAAVKVGIKLFECEDREVVTDISGQDSVRVKKNIAEICTFTGEGEKILRIEERIKAPSGNPSILEILKCDTVFKDKSVKVTDGKVLAGGNLVMSALYTGSEEDEGIYYMEEEIPVSQFVDVEGVYPGDLVDLAVSLQSSVFEISKDSDGEDREISAAIELKLETKALRRKTVEYVDDAYSTEFVLGYEKAKVALENIKLETAWDMTLSEKLDFRGDRGEISGIYNMTCTPQITDVNVTDGRINAEGFVKCSILYMTQNTHRPVGSKVMEIPFETSIEAGDASNGSECEISHRLAHSSYQILNPEEIEIKIVMDFDARVAEIVAIPSVNALRETPVDMPRSGRASFVIYFPASGENLWTIAKKYMTTAEAIQSFNNISEDYRAQEGEQLFIPGRISG